MKLAKITFIIAIMFAVIGWVRRTGPDFGPLPRCIPFMGGLRPSLYDLAGLIIIGLTIWGVCRMTRDHDDSDDSDSSVVDDTEEYEIDEGDEDE